jgi:hypothetical protein
MAAKYRRPASALFAAATARSEFRAHRYAFDNAEELFLDVVSLLLIVQGYAVAIIGQYAEPKAFDET